MHRKRNRPSPSKRAQHQFWTTPTPDADGCSSRAGQPKRAYPTRAVAREAADHVKRTRGGDPRAYKCPSGDHYHVGNARGTDRRGFDAT